MWKGILIRIAESLKFTPPSRRQSFAIRFSCEIENPQPQRADFAIVIPIPQRTSFQIFHSDIEWKDSEITIQKEESYENEFGLWQGRIEGYQKKKCEYSVDVTILPFSSPSPQKQTNISHESRCISASDSRIQKIAQELCFDNPTPAMYARRAYEYVLSHLVYGKPIEGLYTVDDALTLGQVDCGGFSTLLTSLFLAGDISARVVSGFLAPSGSTSSMHAWVEACITSTNQWVAFDPSTDYLFRQGRVFRRSGRFGFVGSDHVVYSNGCDFTLLVNKKQYATPLLQHPFFLFPSQGLLISSHGDITKL